MHQHHVCKVLGAALVSVVCIMGCTPVPIPSATPLATMAVAQSPTDVADAAATNTPLPETEGQLHEIVRRIIDLNEQNALDSAEAGQLFAGELEGWNAPTIGEIRGEATPIVMLDSDSAIARVQIEDGYLFDAYLYFSYDSAWRLTALRAMALPGVVRQEYVELRDKKELSAEEVRVLNSLESLFQTDAEWREMFMDNHAAFDTLCAEIGQLSDSNFIGSDNLSEFPTIQHEFTLLSVSSIERAENDSIQINMSEMGDNAIGFMCSPLNNPPPISPGHFIWVEPIVDGWYLFRTT